MTKRVFILMSGTSNINGLFGSFVSATSKYMNRLCMCIFLISSHHLVSGPSGHLGGAGNRGQNTKGQYGENQPYNLNFNLTIT